MYAIAVPTAFLLATFSLLALLLIAAFPARGLVVGLLGPRGVVLVLFAGVATLVVSGISLLDALLGLLSAVSLGAFWFGRGAL